MIAQICGGLRPDAGRVEVMGRDVTALPTRARARAGLGRTFQVSALAMEDSVLQNAVLGALAQVTVADLARDRTLLDSIPAVAERLMTENPELVNRLIQRWIGEREQYGGV